MFLLRSPTVAVWLLAGAGAYSTGAAWAGNGQAGEFHPWVLVAAFWGVALLSVSVHYLRQYCARAAAWARRSWHESAPERARLLARARLTLAQTSVGARRSWHRHATEGARRLGRARLTLAQTAGSVMRSARHLSHRHAAPARAGQGWMAARRSSEQPIAGARRAPGALIGWSRSALKALRA
jgi:hypothetical protein